MSVVTNNLQANFPDGDLVTSKVKALSLVIPPFPDTVSALWKVNHGKIPGSNW